jgi:peptidoglycan/LPS O-acetylase OafA/YrhL
VQQNFAPLLAYFVFFVPNLAAPPNYAPVLGASQCWSLGVEEQFYLVWPILLSWFASAPLLLFFGVIALKLVVAHAGNFMDGNHIPTAFLWSFSIEAMAAGGIAAYLFLQQKEGKPLAAAVLCALASIIAALVLGYGPLHTAAIVGYAAIIYSATKLPPLGGPFYAPLQFLGKISYGFYMLHATAILICLNLLLLHTDLDHSSSAMNGAIYVSSLILAFIFSVCSYRFFELPFLRLKSSH